MAIPVQPDDPGGEGGGDPGGTGDGTPAAPTPPTQPGTKIALQVSSTSVTITADQIMAAGGPWPKFRVRVTPLNANGAGTPSDEAYTQANFRVTDTGALRITEDGMTRIGE